MDDIPSKIPERNGLFLLTLSDVPSVLLGAPIGADVRVVGGVAHMGNGVDVAGGGTGGGHR